MFDNRTMTKQGLDYGLGTTNVDTDTGIRYGVISQNSVDLQTLSDSQELDYGKPHCPKCGTEIDGLTFMESSDVPDEVQELDWYDGKDFACANCEECFWNQDCYPEESLGWVVEDSEYQLSDCLDNDIFVLKSPYFTYAQYCSPCVPGACSLDSPLDLTVPKGPYYQKRLKRMLDGLSKAYCLGPEWFDEYNPMPYRCFRIADGKEVRS